MKHAFAGAVVVVILGIGTWLYLENEWTKDRGHQIGFALGNPLDDTIELHVIVTRQMTLTDPPPMLPSGAYQPWIEWVAGHFELRDAAGQVVMLNRAGTCPIISHHESFNPEFFVNARLKMGTDYTLDYIPVAGEPRRYRHVLTAPTEPQSLQRLYFQTVGG